MALQEILLQLCDNQAETAPRFLPNAPVDLQFYLSTYRETTTAQHQSLLMLYDISLTE